VREFIDEVAVLSQWLGRDVAADLTGVVPVWNAFRFRDATVFEAELPVCAGRKYLVRGTAVRELIPSQVTIDQAYLELGGESEALPAVA
jgi:CYTH domain-containing protein